MKQIKHNFPPFTHVPTQATDNGVIAGLLRDVDYIREFIHRYRRKLIVHSIIYYELNDNLVNDDTWSRWARELKVVQEFHPELSRTLGFFDEEFEGWEGVTGFALARLPLHETALRLTRKR
jgi:hypothetical protein